MTRSEAAVAVALEELGLLIEGEEEDAPVCEEGIRAVRYHACTVIEERVRERIERPKWLR